jgi:cytochrome c peroxidase
VLERIGRLPDYAGRFEQVFHGRAPSMDSVGEALAAYERTLVAGNSRFDRWRYAGDTQALNAVEQLGFELFTGRARCSSCHLVNDKDALFSDGRFHVTGAGGDGRSSYEVPLAPGVTTRIARAMLDAYQRPAAPDLGRFEVTLNPADRYAFKTPSLRNVAHTAPYMHDGSLATLASVVDFYDRGGGDVEGRSALLQPLHLSTPDKKALVAFLQALDSAALTTLVTSARAPQ